MIIHATGIHIGGGKVLLDEILIRNIFGKHIFLICDKRYHFPAQQNMTTFKIAPNLYQRLKAESLLKKIADNNPNQIVFCFSNLPPRYRLKNKTVLYLQNALLLPSSPLPYTKFKTLLRLLYERIWLKLLLSNCDEIWVQSHWMKNEIQKLTLLPIKISPIQLLLPNLAPTLKQYDFITVTDESPHKNLKKLLEAWKYFPKNYKLLIVAPSLSNKMHNKISKTNNIELRTNVTREELFQLYNQSKCLLVTSEIESYCLPIYEAKHFKLTIIGIDRPYSHEHCDQFVTLDNNLYDQIKTLLPPVI